MSKSKDIVKVNADVGRALYKAAQADLRHDLEVNLLHHAKFFIQEKQRLQRQIEELQEKIVRVDKKIDALESGRVRFDYVNAKLIFPPELEESE